MKQVTLEHYKQPKHLAEIFQSVEVKFAFVNEKYEQVSQPCVCRDFLGDVLWSKFTKRPVSIWGFSYNYDSAPYDEKVLRLSLKFPTEQTQANFIQHLHFLEEKEKIANTKPLEILLTQEHDTVILEADPVWQSNIWKLSLYTFYIKKYSSNNPDNLEKPESTYQQYLTQEIETTLLTNVHNPYKDLTNSLNDNHENRGVIATIKGYNKQEHEMIFKKA